jgi:hypothetical protein
MSDNTDFTITSNAPTDLPEASNDDKPAKPAKAGAKKPGPLSYLDWVERLEKAGEATGGILTAKDCQSLAKLMRSERAKNSGSDQGLTRIAG